VGVGYFEVYSVYNIIYSSGESMARVFRCVSVAEGLIVRQPEMRKSDLVSSISDEVLAVSAPFYAFSIFISAALELR